MPLRLVPPKPGRTPYFHIRGTYLGCYINRSARTGSRAVARQLARAIERQIERGAFSKGAAVSFASAAVGYMKAGGERRPLVKLLKHFGTKPLNQIDQAAIDNAAAILFPTGTAATRNREVYTPVSAVLKHVGAEFRIKRPKGARGLQINAWLWPEEAERLFKAADGIDKEFGILIALLCYTGLRLSEALRIHCDHLRLAESYVQVGQTKTGDPRGVYLPPYIVARLANHPRGLDRPGQRLFRFAKSGHLYELLAKAAKAAGITMPTRAAFHLFRHTYATWMRRYGGRDVKGLVATGAWRSEQSASRYAHVVPSEDARAADRLPTPCRNGAEKA